MTIKKTSKYYIDIIFTDQDDDVAEPTKIYYFSSTEELIEKLQDAILSCIELIEEEEGEN